MNAKRTHLPLLALLVVALVLLLAGCPRAAHASTAGEEPQEELPASIAALGAAFGGVALGCAVVLAWWILRKRR